MTEPRALDFDDLAMDDFVRVERRASTDAIDAFAAVSGDRSPIHVDAEAARAAGFADRVAHGALVGAWFSEIVGMRLPGERALLVELRLDFRRPVLAGDAVTLEARVDRLSEATRHLRLALRAEVRGECVATGKAGVIVR